MAGIRADDSDRGRPGEPAADETILILGFALGALAFHFLVNAFGGYGIFRDEFYYIACSKRLAAGYVDQPPLSIFLMAAGRSVFGASQLGIRIIPALAHALTVALTGLLALRLGGPRLAVVLSCLAVLLAPIIIATTNIFSMNSFSYCFWALGAYLLIRIVDRSSPWLWLVLGLVMGLGLLNKIDYLWFGFGLAAALLLTDLRRHLKTPWPYAAAGIAFLLFSPFIIWNITHNFAHLEFIRNASSSKYAGLTRIGFLKDQVGLLNPANMLLWVPGLLFLLFGRQGRRYRILGIIYAAALAILVANPHSKAEYLGPAYPMLFAAGGVAVERWASRGRRKWAAALLAGLSVVTSLLILPMVLPVLPVETYIRYSAAIGFKPSTPEGKKLRQLPQHFADMFGWEGLAKDVSAAYQRLPEEERGATVVFTQNYGEAGALEYYATKYPLPRVISGHNSYWIWGYPAEGFRTVLVVGGRAEDCKRSCGSVKLAGIHMCRHCMPYENALPIFVCRDLRLAPAEIWKSAKMFI